MEFTEEAKESKMVNLHIYWNGPGVLSSHEQLVIPTFVGMVIGTSLILAAWTTCTPRRTWPLLEVELKGPGVSLQYPR